MKSGRREFLDPIRNPQGFSAAARDIERRIQRVERAPVKFSLPRVKEPKKAADARVVGVTTQPEVWRLIVISDRYWTLDMGDAEWTDRGAAPVPPPSSLFDNNIAAMASGSRVFYIDSMSTSGAGELMRSTDSGITFSLVATPLDTVVDLAMGTSRIAIVGFEGADLKTYRSDDWGDSWTLVATAAESPDVNAAVAVSLNDQIVGMYYGSLDTFGLRKVVSGAESELSALYPYSFVNAVDATFDGDGDEQVLWHHENASPTARHVFLNTASKGEYDDVSDPTNPPPVNSVISLGAHGIVRITSGYVALLDDKAIVNGVDQALPQSTSLTIKVIGAAYIASINTLFLVFSDGRAWKIPAPAAAWSATELPDNTGMFPVDGGNAYPYDTMHVMAATIL